MKAYFVHDGKQQHGPYSLEELKQKPIDEHSLIWTDQLKGWTPAGQVDSLKSLFAKPADRAKNPPPLKHPARSKNNIRNISILGILCIVIALTAVIMLRPKASSANVKIQTASPKTVIADTTVVLAVSQPVEKKPEIKPQAAPAPAKPEKFNVAKYLVKTDKVRKNFVGQTVIEGNITNTSTAVYKDIVLDVKYLSKTGSLISTQRLVVYEVAKPNKRISFKFKIRSPQGTNNVSADIVDALVVK